MIMYGANGGKGWTQSPGHNAPMLNLGNWNKEWKGLGAAIYGGYAHLWFGYEEDPLD